MYKRIFTIKLSDLSSSRPWGVGGGVWGHASKTGYRAQYEIAVQDVHDNL